MTKHERRVISNSYSVGSEFIVADMRGQQQAGRTRLLASPMRLYGLAFRRTISGWNTEACATPFVSASSQTCGLLPFILTVLSRLRTDFMERAQMQSSALVP
jgi:hypothetical protein